MKSDKTDEISSTDDNETKPITLTKFSRIGKILYVDLEFLAFYLNIEEQYGLLMNTAWVIVYFEFDKNARWDKTTGGRNNKVALIVDQFQKTNGLSSWYFDHENGSFLTVDNDSNIVLVNIEITYKGKTSDVEKF